MLISIDDNIITEKFLLDLYDKKRHYNRKQGKMLI